MTHKSKLQNIICCILAVLASGSTSLRASKKYLTDWMPFIVQISIVVLCLLGLIIYTILQKRKDEGAVNQQSFFAFWHGVLRYFIAMDMIMFGLQKVFHMQFVIPLGVLDNPFSSLSGEQLVWAFFGKYYSFTIIIAGMQILGAMLLLFRRTWLIGVIVLLPIMLNILLLDWYYGLALVVNMYITVLTISTIYLLLTEYGRLQEFFLKSQSNLPTMQFKSNTQKVVLRCLVIATPILLISTYKFPKTYPEIYGKYEVKNLVINDTFQIRKPCNDSVLTKIFIDKGDFVLEFNNYTRRFIGSYNYNSNTKKIIAVWRYPRSQHDTLFAQMQSGKTPNTKVLSGRMGRQIFKMELIKVAGLN
jgi:hypothetical protein